MLEELELPLHSTVLIEKDKSCCAPVFFCVSSALAFILNNIKKIPLGNIAFHSADFMRIFLLLFIRIGRWLHEFFLLLAVNHSAPSMLAQQTWIGLILMNAALISAMVIKIINYKYRASELALHDYIFATFSSSIVFMLARMFLGLSGNSAFPIDWFVAITIVVPVAMYFFAEFVLPDSGNHFIITKKKREEVLTFPVFLNAGKVERCLNLISGAFAYMFTSLSVACWNYDRERAGETVAIRAWWEYGLITLGTLSAVKVGYDLTVHPEKFFWLVVVSKFLLDGSLVFASFSGFDTLLAAYIFGCPDASCLNNQNRTVLDFAVSLPAALITGFFSAATTHLNFQRIHDRRVKRIQSVRSIPTKISGLLFSCSEKIQHVFQRPREDISLSVC